jgi:hypothetical protein
MNMFQRPFLLLVAALLADSAAIAAKGAARESGNDLSIGNKYLELRFQRKGDQMAATTLVNRIVGRTIKLSADDFALNIEGQPSLHVADFALQQATREPIPGGQRMSLHFAQRGGTSQVEVVYELLDEDFFLRRHLEFSPALPMPLRQVDVWRVGVKGECSSQEFGPPEYMRHNVWGVEGKKGFGQPVLLEDTFWGLEFPAGYNQYTGGAVTLTHFPGRTVTGRFVSKTAVAGVAPAGHVAPRFRFYIEQYRGRPRQPEVQVDYNTWTTLNPATESNSLDLISQFKKNLFEPYGVSFDSFTLDDGWDEKNSLWELRASGFPRGFNPLLEALQSMGTKLGLWFSPSSGYGHAGWGGENGYTQNATSNWFLCQSDPNYRRDMCRIVPELIRKNTIGFFKMDGFCASCDTHRHPHHLEGNYAREANVDALIELITAMRKANPGVYLDLTSGSWLSPWWLRYVDSIYGYTYDGTPPALLPSPNGLDGATTTRDALLRRRLAQNPGFDASAVETLGVYLDPTLVVDQHTFFDNWQDNAMMVAGRGARLLTFYMNPAQFPNPPKDWAFLVGMIQWARHNASTLARTEMILGDPYRMEAYGYAHFVGQRGILALRNPFIQPQTVRVRLNETAGWTASDAGNGTYAASIVFPYCETLRQTLHYGDALEMELEPYQTVLVQIEATNLSAPTLAGVQAYEIRRSSEKITWEIFALPGTKVSVAVKGLPAPKRTTLDGRDILAVKTDQGLELPLTFEGNKMLCPVADGALQYDDSANVYDQEGSHLVGKCTVSIPHGVKASMFVLCLDPPPLDDEFRCRATVNRNVVLVTAIRCPSPRAIPAETLAELPLNPWVFFRFDLPEGESEVAVSIQAGEKYPKPFAVRAGWWLWAEQPLKKGTLMMEFGQPLSAVPVNPLPFPSGMEFQRQVVPLQPLKAFVPASKTKSLSGLTPNHEN